MEREEFLADMALHVIGARKMGQAAGTDFVAIGFSALGGWWMFGHLPDTTAVCGMLMIAGFGLAAGWLNQRKAPA